MTALTPQTVTRAAQLLEAHQSTTDALAKLKRRSFVVGINVTSTQTSDGYVDLSLDKKIGVAAIVAMRAEIEAQLRKLGISFKKGG